MAEPREFHLGDILSVTTDRLVSPGLVPAVHELLDYMTGDTLFTHQLPRASDECKPELLRQHPDLAGVQVPDQFDSDDHVWSWLAEQVATYGQTRQVKPMAPENHTRIHPLQELAMNHPHLTVVPVVVEDDVDG
jgi:hypothetical protein